MSDFKVYVIGCGSAHPSLKHLTSCQVVRCGTRLMVVDCGEYAQVGILRMHLNTQHISDIFLSHLHGDHCFGLPGLVASMGLSQRTAPLTIHLGADGLDIVQRTLNYFCRDMAFEVRYNILPPGNSSGTEILRTRSLTVTTLPLDHRVPATGFLFRELPKLRHIVPEQTARWQVPTHFMHSLRQGFDFVTADGQVIPNSVLTSDPTPAVSYAYCSDTRPSAALTEALHGVDWIYHEATYGDSEITLAKKRYHSTARQAAQTALQAGAKRLVIGHFSQRYHNCEHVLLQQAREVFPPTTLAKEGLCIDLADTDWHEDCSPTNEGNIYQPTTQQP